MAHSDSLCGPTEESGCRWDNILLKVSRELCRIDRLSGLLAFPSKTNWRHVSMRAHMGMILSAMRGSSPLLRSNRQSQHPHHQQQQTSADYFYYQPAPRRPAQQSSRLNRGGETLRSIRGGNPITIACVENPTLLATPNNPPVLHHQTQSPLAHT